MTWPAGVIGRLEQTHNLADVVVELLDHGTVKRIGLAGLIPFLLVLFGQLHAEFLLVLPQQSLTPHDNRRVHQPGRVVEKKSIVFAVPNEIERPLLWGIKWKA